MVMVVTLVDNITNIITDEIDRDTYLLCPYQVANPKVVFR